MVFQLSAQLSFLKADRNVYKHGATTVAVRERAHDCRLSADRNYVSNIIKERSRLGHQIRCLEILVDVSGDFTFEK